MTKQELALEVIERLKKEYPDADCTLDYDNAWKLLVSVRLAAQCTDARVNVVVQDLYAKYPTVEALANADVADIEAIVRPCGLGKSKARDISACMKVLHEQYHDNVPDDFDALLKLPGVGRKSANLIMGDVFGKPAIVTDTHWHLQSPFQLLLSFYSLQFPLIQPQNADIQGVSYPYTAAGSQADNRYTSWPPQDFPAYHVH